MSAMCADPQRYAVTKATGAEDTQSSLAGGCFTSLYFVMAWNAGLRAIFAMVYHEMQKQQQPALLAPFQGN